MKENKPPKRISPQQVMWLIEHGREDEIPKSKTWYKFMEYLRKNPMPTPQIARMIDIPTHSMEKFITGNYVISSTNMKKIQDYLKSLDI